METREDGYETLQPCRFDYIKFVGDQDIDASSYDLTVISQRNHMVFTPLLASACVGTLESRAVAQPILKLQVSFSSREAFRSVLVRACRLLIASAAIKAPRKDAPFLAYLSQSIDIRVTPLAFPIHYTVEHWAAYLRILYTRMRFHIHFCIVPVSACLYICMHTPVSVWAFCSGASTTHSCLDLIVVLLWAGYFQAALHTLALDAQV